MSVIFLFVLLLLSMLLGFVNPALGAVGFVGLSLITGGMF